MSHYEIFLLWNVVIIICSYYEKCHYETIHCLNLLVLVTYSIKIAGYDHKPTYYDLKYGW